MVIVELNDLQGLVSALQSRGFIVIGPTVRDGAIVIDSIGSVDDLPRGWRDVQEAGSYAIERRDDNALFGFNVGPHSWKKFLFPARMRLFGLTRAGKGFEVESAPREPAPRFAFFGVRPCELAAIAVQDGVFMTGPYADQHYTMLRSAAFLVTVNCVHVGGTCFCDSMGTGPRATKGFDLAMTEVIGDGVHHFLVEVGSPEGKSIMDEVKHRDAEQHERERVDRLLKDAADSMGRTLDTKQLPEILREGFEHPHWDDIAKRCMSCANCTLVCPTCFCSTVEDTTSLTGDRAERLRRWDSCFTADFSRIAGGNIRMSTRTRYRQWMTHKLSSWVDQFGTMGCVGCGRCITWCPVGIDITAEAAMIRENSMSTLNG